MTSKRRRNAWERSRIRSGTDPKTIRQRPQNCLPQGQESAQMVLSHPPNNPKSAPLTGFRGGPAGSRKYVICSLLFFRLGSVSVWGVSGAKTEPNSHPIRAQLAPKSLPEALLSDISPNAHEIFKNLKFSPKKIIPPTPKCPPKGTPKGAQTEPKSRQNASWKPS